jgi:hypothetical protein
MGQHVAIHISPQPVALQHGLQVVIALSHPSSSSSSSCSLADAASCPEVVEVLKHLQTVECRLLEFRKRALMLRWRVVEREARGGGERRPAAATETAAARVILANSEMARSTTYVALHRKAVE